jgi:hypothetical protein
MTFEQRLEVHPELAELPRPTVDKAIAFVEDCCADRQPDFGILDHDPEMYQAFKVLIFGECHFPPLEKLSSGHLTDGAKVAAEFCPRSFCKNTQQPADNKGVLVAPPGRRGRKRLITPDRIIKDLAMTKGFGARKITAELERRGLQVNLRTVTRRLRAIHSQELPLFKN